VRLHQAACGEDAAPLVPSEEVPRFVERMTLEWPIEGLEPLAFVLARVCDALCGALERADRAAVVVTTRLRLVTRTDHERRLQLPAPMRDSRVLRTLIMLDVESHPPPAGIDAVEVEVDVAPGRIVQGSLLVRALPSPETLSTLIARLGALMGETRVGAPARVDLHDGRQVALVAFAPESRRAIASLSEPARLRVLRRFRHPLAVRVAVERGLPVGVHALARAVTSGRVLVASGPWRTSGRWWTRDRTAWDRDEWDVALTDGGLYRLARDRRTDVWELEGIVD
jgi:protein ImuB